MARAEVSDLEMAELGALIRGVAKSRLKDPHTIDDVVQETLTRVLEVRHRLDDDALAPYAITIARNFIASLARGADRRRRNLYRLVDLRELPPPETIVLEEEDRSAIKRALSKLSSQDRDAVVAHHVARTDTATIARATESTPGRVAARLARARARLRVEYFVALNGEPPTPRCRPVLVALSAADHRRQTALDAGAHLLDCRYCAALGDHVVERRRIAVALIPLALLLFLKGSLLKALKIPLVKGAAAIGLAGMTAFGAYHFTQRGPEPTQQGPEPIDAAVRRCGDATGAFVVPGRGRVDAARLGKLEDVQGDRLTACAVEVISVPADEGFWIETGGGGRLWVQLIGAGESPTNVDKRDRVSFQGEIVANRIEVPEDSIAPSVGEGRAR
jgi:RNA polymerase sigma factor (sigma-70 family)